jgi:hypothetical protein
VLAEALNKAAVSAEFDRVCGSASISVRLLESVHLGQRPLAGRPDKEGRHEHSDVSKTCRNDATLSAVAP